MINETTEGQAAGEQREALFFKVIKAGNKILEILAALFIILMLLYGAYSLWDTCQINRRAFISGELMKYKPVGKSDESPSLQELQKINPDVCAWLTVDGTKIDYPVVQGETNLEYINQDIYGEFALSGSIFLDSRNDRKFIDSYSLLYGHHMDNGAMFGDVMNYKEKKYFESHKTGTLYLNEQLEKIQWFACVETDAYDEVIYNPQDYKKENLEELMEYIKAHAVQYRLPEKKGKEGWNRIIGLSTCSNDQTNGRVILYGFLYDRDRLLFTPVSITPLIDTEDACFDLNASRPIAKGDLKWRDALLVAHRVNSNYSSERKGKVMRERLTKNDVEKIQAEIEHRKLVERKELIEAVKEARSHGDLSENFEYHAAKKAKNQNESRIRYLERMLKTAEIVEDHSKEDEIGLNNTVELYCEDDDEIETYRIVTSVRGSSLNGLVSIESPIGKALLGHKEGERVYIKVNDDFGYYVVIRKVIKTESEEEDQIRSF